MLFKKAAGYGLALCGLLLFSRTPPAEAAFHLMVIEEICRGCNGDPNVEYVVLRMWVQGQKFVSTQSIVQLNDEGLQTASFGTFTENVPNGNRDDRILVGTAAAQAFFGVPFDLVVPRGLVGPSGQICFANEGAPFSGDCVAFGDYQGQRFGGDTTLAPALVSSRALKRPAGNNLLYRSSQFFPGDPRPMNNAGALGFVPVEFAAILEGGQVVPPVSSPASGAARLELHGDRLFFDVGFNGLTTPETVSHIRRAVEGENGPIAFSLDPGLRKAGLLDLSAGDPGAVGADLRQGNFYVEVQSTMFPAGELRGQIYPRLDIFPGTSTLTTDTTFDLTVVCELPQGVSIVGATVLFDGVDVLAGLLACIGGQVAPLGGSREGLAFTCSGLQLAEGSHQFSLTVDLSDGSKKAGSVSWEVLNTRP